MQLLARPKPAILSACAATAERPQSREEEIANSLSHGLGLAAALAASTMLIVTAVQRGRAAFIYPGNFSLPALLVSLVGAIALLAVVGIFRRGTARR
jgi:hemolysin III